MKKTLLPVAVLTAATLCASTAIAANKAETFSMTPFIGGLHYDGITHNDPALLYGLKLGYNITERFGIEAVAEAAKSPRARQEGINFLDYRLEGLYHILPKKDLVPYLAVGYGGMRYKDNYTGEDARGGIFAYGAGVKYFMSDMFGLRGDVRHLIIDRGPTTNHYEYTLGAMINFSEATPPPKPVEPAPAPVVEPPPAPKPAPAPAPAPAPVPAPPVVKPAPLPGPTASLSAIPASIEAGDSATLNWSSQNSSDCSIAPTVGQVQPNGTMIVAPADTTSYTLSCAGAGGSAQSIATVAVKPKPVVPKVVDSDMDGVPDEMDKCPDTPAGVKVDQNGCPPPVAACKNFTLEIEFETGKADIKATFNKEIKKIADFLKDNPGSTANIEGHTDNVGSDSMNMKLSQRRADAVRSYLIKKFGVAADRLTAKGFGETKPRATNKTAQGRHENRRVEAIVFCGDKSFKASDHDTHR
jgi:OOP family OmpA-OmpF porin